MISIIICSVENNKFSAVSDNYGRLLNDRPFEIIRITDAQSLAEGYNRGVEQCIGDIIIFSHDDIEILSEDFAYRLLGRLRSFDLIGVAGTSRVLNGSWFTAGQPAIFGHVLQPIPSQQSFRYDMFDQFAPVCGGIQALDGLFFATRRDIADAIRFDSTTFDGFHVYDVDFSYRVYLSGFRLAVCNDILIYHQSTGTRDDKWIKYVEAFNRKFAGRLTSFYKPGPPNLWQIQVQTKVEALQIFKERLQALQTMQSVNLKS